VTAVNYRSAMAYDPDLADRVRELVATEDNLTEKRMFGGLAFLVAGNMAVAAGSDGGLMVRTAPADLDALVDGAHARPMVMRGRELRGWLLVAAPALTDDDALAGWVRHGVAYARTLPPKN
jgi:TfoX/Sxy family transcriptional regulator of competence genes